MEAVVFGATVALTEFDLEFVKAAMSRARLRPTSGSCSSIPTPFSSMSGPQPSALAGA
jgi:hypothetical protein